MKTLTSGDSPRRCQRRRSLILMRKGLTSLAFVFLGLMTSGVGSARTLKRSKGRKGFVPLPSLKGKSNSKLKIKFKAYTGGKVTAEVKNSSSRARPFHPAGVFFVPVNHPDKAPQRMGAAGPYEVYDGGAWKPVTKSYKIPAGKKGRVRLQVFCLDHHRASPQNGQKFYVAKRRLPKKLRRKIRKGVTKALGGRRSYKAAPRAKGAVQTHIWNVRGRKWKKLEGEGTQEKNRGKRSYRMQRRVRRRVRRRNVQRKVAPKPKVHKNPFLRD